MISRCMAMHQASDCSSCGGVKGLIGALRGGIDRDVQDMSGMESPKIGDPFSWPPLCKPPNERSRIYD